VIVACRFLEAALLRSYRPVIRYLICWLWTYSRSAAIRVNPGQKPTLLKSGQGSGELRAKVRTVCAACVVIDSSWPMEVYVHPVDHERTQAAVTAAYRRENVAHPDPCFGMVCFMGSSTGWKFSMTGSCASGCKARLRGRRRVRGKVVSRTGHE
jgi:hypothetical protein